MQFMLKRGKHVISPKNLNKVPYKNWEYKAVNTCFSTSFHQIVLLDKQATFWHMKPTKPQTKLPSFLKKLKNRQAIVFLMAISTQKKYQL